MLRLFQVNDLAARKKLLVLQSDIHRQTMLLQIATAQASVERIKKHFTMLSVTSVAAGLGAVLARTFFGKSEGSEKSGLISKIVSGFSYFGQIKSLFNRFKASTEDQE